MKNFWYGTPVTFLYHISNVTVWVNTLLLHNNERIYRVHLVKILYFSKGSMDFNQTFRICIRESTQHMLQIL